jgi:hypothetical protein
MLVLSASQVFLEEINCHHVKRREDLWAVGSRMLGVPS